MLGSLLGGVFPPLSFIPFRSTVMMRKGAGLVRSKKREREKKMSADELPQICCFEMVINRNMRVVLRCFATIKRQRLRNMKAFWENLMSSTIKLHASFFFFVFAVKPMFSESSLGTYTVVEGQTREISLQAVGNPPEIEYTWSLPSSVAVEVAAAAAEATDADSSRVSRRGAYTIVVNRARRTDAGNYTVTAANSYGDFSTTVSVELDVLYPPE